MQNSKRKQIRMQTTALSGRIMAGYPNAKGTYLTEGSRQDVTSDFMKCLIEKAEFHGGEFDILGNDEKWQVSVKKVVKPVAQPVCGLCKGETTVPSNLSEGYVMDCPACCGEEG